MTSFNAAGIPSEDFLIEVSDSAMRKKNQLYFALTVTGIAGDPAFGVGLQDLVYEDATEDTGDIVREFLTTKLEDAVDNITVNNIMVTAIPTNKAIGISVTVTDKETQEVISLPIAIGRN